MCLTSLFNFSILVLFQCVGLFFLSFCVNGAHRWTTARTLLHQQATKIAEHSAQIVLLFLAGGKVGGAAHGPKGSLRALVQWRGHPCLVVGSLYWMLLPPPPCISYANVHNCYGP